MFETFHVIEFLIIMVSHDPTLSAFCLTPEYGLLGISGVQECVQLQIFYLLIIHLHDCVIQEFAHPLFPPTILNRYLLDKKERVITPLLIKFKIVYGFISPELYYMQQPLQLILYKQTANTQQSR